MKGGATLLCIGAGAEQLPAVRRALALGCRVVGVDGDPLATALPHCTERHVVDIGDPEHVLRIAEAAGVTGVLPAPIGKLVTLAGRVNDELGLLGPSHDTCIGCADKRRFATLIGRAARLLSTPSDIDPASPPLEPPFVAKPARGSGGRGVCLVDSTSRWAAWCADHAAEDYPDGVLIEPFVRGRSYGVDAVVQGGRVHVVLLRGKRIEQGPSILETAFYALCDAEPVALELATLAVQAAVETLGYRHGLLHADLIVDEEGAHVIEMSPRPSGLHNTSHLVPSSTGIDILAQGIGQVCGARLELEPTKREHWGVRYLSLGPGYLGNLPGIGAVAHLHGVREWRTNLSAGQRLETPVSMRDLLDRGYLLARGDSPAALASNLERAHSMFHADDTPARDSGRDPGREHTYERERQISKRAHASHVGSTRALYPDERLVAFMNRRFGTSVEGSGRKALDVGFGAGRHIQLLANFGFETHGIEYTEEAVSAARATLDERTLSRVDSLVLADFRRYRPAAPFDAVVGWGLLVHSEYDSIVTDLGHLAGLLAETGSLFVNFRTSDNWFHGLGRSMGEKTYNLDERAREYEGYIYSFVDGIDDVRALAARAGLEIASAERVEVHKNDLRDRHSWLICELRRPSR